MPLDTRFTSQFTDVQRSGVVLLVNGLGVYDVIIERFNGSTWDDVAYLQDVKESGALYVDVLPLDGVARQYRAKFVEQGFQDGPYTGTLTATPVRLDDDGATLPFPSLVVRCRLVDGRTNPAQYELVVTDPIPQAPITVSLSAPSNTPSFTVTSGQVVTFTANRSSQQVGRVEVVASSPNRVNGTDAVDVPQLAVVDNTPATVTVGTPIPSAHSINIPITFGSATRYVEVWAREDRVSPTGLSDDIYQTGYQLKNSPILEDTTITVPVALAGNFIITWIVPFDAQGRRGTIQRRTVQSLVAPTTPPDAFQARSNIGTTATSVTNRVQMPSTNLPATIRVYRNGVFFADISRTSGANTNQDMMHSGLTPNTAYVWQYEPLAADGTAGPRTSTLPTTTAVQQLDPPDVGFLGAINGVLRFQWLNPSAYPAGATILGEYERGGPWLGLSTVSTDVLESIEDNSGQSGTARFRVSAPNFTTSDFNTPIVWFGGGNPL